MEEKDDGLGLSLGLSLGSGGGGGAAQSKPSFKLNLMQKKPFHLHQKASPWNEIFQLSSDRSSGSRSLLPGLDVNRKPAGADYEEENGVSSPNSTVSSLSGKRSERERIEEEIELERDSCSRGSDDEDGNGGENSRKKLRLSKDQAMVLEETFKEHSTLNPKQKLALAKRLSLRPRQVEVWFQNRRARTKLKQTEVDCEHLKMCCERLTEENRRLQKEVHELRALKLSPQMYMQMTPPTTLTMCPSCERVAPASSSAPAPAVTNRQPAIARPVPINPWAALQRRSLDAPASRS